MSFLDVSKIASKLGVFSIPDGPDEPIQGHKDYGYTHDDSTYEGGYSGAPPDGYPGGPQEGVEEYKQTHPDYSTSDPTRIASQTDDDAYPPTYPSYSSYSPHAYPPRPERRDSHTDEDIVDDDEEEDEERKRPQEPPPVPEGWIARFNDRYGQWYFVDKLTGASQWHPPTRSPYDRYRKEEADDNPEDALAGEAKDPDGYPTGEARNYWDNSFQIRQDIGEQTQTQGHYDYSGGQHYGYEQDRGHGYSPYEQRHESEDRPYGYEDGEYAEERKEKKKKKKSKYGKILLGAAGGIAVGALGGALIANALASDSGDEEGAEVVAPEPDINRGFGDDEDEPLDRGFNEVDEPEEENDDDSDGGGDVEDAASSSLSSSEGDVDDEEPEAEEDSADEEPESSGDDDDEEEEEEGEEEEEDIADEASESSGDYEEEEEEEWDDDEE